MIGWLLEGVPKPHPIKIVMIANFIVEAKIKLNA
jgi:hypothetical protein